MPVSVVTFDIPDARNLAGLAAALDGFDAMRIRRLALFSKLNGEYDDGSREHAKAAVDALLTKLGLADRTEMVTIIGCEGASTSFGYAFVDTGDGDPCSGGARLAIGLSRASPGAEQDFDQPIFGERVAAVVSDAMADAGLTPADVATVIVNVPPATSGDAVLRSRRARAVGALGAGVALGEIKTGDIVASAIIVDDGLHTLRVQTYVGPQVKNIEAIVIGNRAGAGGDLVACSAVTSDLFDVRSIKRMLLAAGLSLDADGELADSTRVVAAIVKAGVGRDGQVSGAATAIYNSRTPPEKHVRAATSGVYGAILKTTRVFSTFDPVQQAPLGGAALCCIVRAT